jgi:hypothetical protein
VREAASLPVEAASSFVRNQFQRAAFWPWKAPSRGAFARQSKFEKKISLDDRGILAALSTSLGAAVKQQNGAAPVETVKIRFERPITKMSTCRQARPSFRQNLLVVLGSQLLCDELHNILDRGQFRGLAVYTC